MAQMQRPSSKGLTPAQRAARLAAEKKAYEKYLATRTPTKGLTPEQRAARTAADAKAAEALRKSRPSKAKLAEIYTEQQNRLRRSKTVAPKPAVKRPGATPAPLGTGPKNPAPRRGNAAPAPLGTPSAKPTGRRPAMPKTTKKAPATSPKKPQKMTPQDAAMKKILESKYGKIYG